jgi:glycosyltransferase involved in cell wall biosynthesis
MAHRNMEEHLTIVTIAYEESRGLLDTFDSIKKVLKGGARWVLVINKELKYFEPPAGAVVIQGEDKGLYDALNIGISKVKTDYFMLLHSGDIIFDVKALRQSLSLMNNGYDIVLGGAVIGNRLHKSYFWRRWMMLFFVQPPHLPIIYKATTCRYVRYNTTISTVADYYYLKALFSRRGFSYVHSNQTYVKMSTGGLTTSGIESIWHVTLSFKSVEGIKSILTMPFRLLLKIILR